MFSIICLRIFSQNRWFSLDGVAEYPRALDRLIAIQQANRRSVLEPIRVGPAAPVRPVPAPRLASLQPAVFYMPPNQPARVYHPLHMEVPEFETADASNLAKSFFVT